MQPDIESLQRENAELRQRLLHLYVDLDCIAQLQQERDTVIVQRDILEVRLLTLEEITGVRSPELF